MYIIPLNQKDYQTFPVGKMNENGEFVPDKRTIQITEEEYAGLMAGTHIFNSGLTGIIKYTPTAEDLSKKEKEKQLHEITIQIGQLKAQLAASDYKVMKFAEGIMSETEFAPVRAERSVLREQINRLEPLLKL